MSEYTLQARCSGVYSWGESIHTRQMQLESLTLEAAWEFADARTAESISGIQYRVAEVVTVTTMAEAPRPPKGWELHKQYKEDEGAWSSSTPVTVDALSEDGYAMLREGEDGTRYVAAPGSRHNYMEV